MLVHIAVVSSDISTGEECIPYYPAAKILQVHIVRYCIYTVDYSSFLFVIRFVQYLKPLAYNEKKYK
jgi:hypothetical protein